MTLLPALFLSLIGKPDILNLLNLPLINVKFSDILDYKYGESIKKLENFSKFS